MESMGVFTVKSSQTPRRREDSQLTASQLPVGWEGEIEVTRVIVTGCNES